MRYDLTFPRGDQIRDTLNPLLRNLLEAGLVVRADGPDGLTWQLVRPAQRRLDELAPGEVVPAEDLVYLDHRCGTCREQKATYFVAERYLCAQCRSEEGIAESAAVAAAQALRKVARVSDDHERARRWVHLPWSARTGRRDRDASDIGLYRASSGDVDEAPALPPGPREQAS